MCFRTILRQNPAFFDRDEHSTGTLTQMLGQEATAMAGLSGLNLGSILTVLFGLSFGAILAYVHIRDFNNRIAYGWKLALIAISLLPVLLVTGYLEMRLQDHLQDDLREAYGKSAQLACEQISAIRTVASLRRENALLSEFVLSMEGPVRKAMLSTAKSTFVSNLSTFSNNSIIRSVRVLRSSSMRCCFGTVALFSELVNILSLSSLLV